MVTGGRAARHMTEKEDEEQQGGASRIPKSISRVREEGGHQGHHSNTEQ